MLSLALFLLLFPLLIVFCGTKKKADAIQVNIDQNQKEQNTNLEKEPINEQKLDPPQTNPTATSDSNIVEKDGEQENNDQTKGEQGKEEDEEGLKHKEKSFQDKTQVETLKSQSKAPKSTEKFDPDRTQGKETPQEPSPALTQQISKQEVPQNSKLDSQQPPKDSKDHKSVVIEPNKVTVSSYPGPKTPVKTPASSHDPDAADKTQALPSPGKKIPSLPPVASSVTKTSGKLPAASNPKTSGKLPAVSSVPKTSGKVPVASSPKTSGKLPAASPSGPKTADQLPFAGSSDQKQSKRIPAVTSGMTTTSGHAPTAAAPGSKTVASFKKAKPRRGKNQSHVSKRKYKDEDTLGLLSESMPDFMKTVNSKKGSKSNPSSESNPSDSEKAEA